jgi:hypothetical protein
LDKKAALTILRAMLAEDSVGDAKTLGTSCGCRFDVNGMVLRKQRTLY